MLASEDRKAIVGRFDGRDAVANQNLARDPDAVVLIAQDPAAPCNMAQSAPEKDDGGCMDDMDC